MSPQDHRVAIFLHSGDYDRVHQGLSIAAAAAASGRRVDIFLFWWALQRFLDDALDDPDFSQEHAAAEDRFEARGLPTIRELLSHARATGLCRLYACTGSLQVLAATPEGAARFADQLVGWSFILQLTEGVVDRFYL